MFFDLSSRGPDCRKKALSKIAQKISCKVAVHVFGGPKGLRSLRLRIANPTLFRLSYEPIKQDALFDFALCQLSYARGARYATPGGARTLITVLPAHISKIAVCVLTYPVPVRRPASPQRRRLRVPSYGMYTFVTPTNALPFLRMGDRHITDYPVL